MERRNFVLGAFMFPLLYPLATENEASVETPSKIEILLFSATWCGPCQSLKARLKSAGLYDKVTLVDCSDGAEYKKWTTKYKFKGVPQMVVLRDGKEIDRGASVELVRKYTK